MDKQQAIAAPPTAQAATGPADKRSMRDLPRLVRHGPWVIAGCYLVVALAWILLSDAALDWLGLSEDQQRQWQTWKGIAYVLVTALLLLGGCVWIQHRVMRVLRWLRDSESTYRTLFEDNPNPMWIYDPASLRFLRVNQAAQRLYGFSADEFAGMTIRDIRPPQAQDDLDRVLESLGAQPALKGQRVVHWHKAHHLLDVQISSYPLWYEGRSARLVLAVDVSEQAQAERALLAETRRLHDAHRMARLGDWQMDLVGGALSGSPEFVRLLGYAPDMPLTWNHYLQHVHSEDRQRISDAWNALLQTGHPLFIEHRLVVPGVPLRHVQLRAEVDAYHEMQRLRGTLMDITEHQHYHDALHKAAHFDALTGLPNRAHFYERLRHQCDDSQQRRTGFALLFIDLDRFKIINDSLGHGAGDELLRLVAERLNETVQGRGFIARLGGDEFALLLARDADMDNVNALAGALVETLAKPFVLLGHPSFITLSIGVARFPDDGTDPETLLRHADLAMYAAKNGGRNNFQYFRADRDKTSPDQVHLESEMHLALERNEFELFYQGQYRASDLQLVGAECLLRWRHPERGLVSPAQFIPLLEETGLIVRTGRWVLEESCRVLQAWQREGLDPKTFSLAVNLSAHQVNREQLMGDITELLDGYGLEPGVLGLELTESSIMQEPARAGQLFRQLRSMGVQIAIDDFGTGYSSLSYLRRFAPDLLKIDRSFVADILKEDKDLEIVTGIIQLAHTLGIEVVAEGVETEAQLARLQSVGCDYVQGFLLARPVPQADFEAMLRERHLIKASR